MNGKPPDLHDREKEWARLAELVESEGPELCVVLGRRRAGKSHLLTRFAAVHGGIYYQATRMTEKEQLAALSRVVGERFGDPAFTRVAFEEWEHFFSYLVEKASGEPLLLVLDEFPYLADAAPALTSIIQHEWDHRLPGTRIKLVLSGSHITAMRRLTSGDEPLFGRRTARVEISPFDYADAARFAPAYGSRDRLRLYGMLGGLPGQLALVDPRRTLKQNAARLLLDPAARLHDEAVHMFDAFLGDAEVHYSIVDAVARGETRWSKISNRVGRNSSSLLNPLNWLMDMEVIRQEAPVTEYPNPARSKMRYVLTDPYLVFWHRFIADIRARGLTTLHEAGALWEAYVEPRLDSYMGMVFEEACRGFVSKANGARLPFRPIHVGRWWSDDGQDEIDVVALGTGGEVLFGEVKWGSINEMDLETLERRSDLVLPRLPGVRSVHFALFCGGRPPNEATRALLAKRGAFLFMLDELYADS